jgi:hypothetical protein
MTKPPDRMPGKRMDMERHSCLKLHFGHPKVSALPLHKPKGLGHPPPLAGDVGKIVWLRTSEIRRTVHAN